MAGQSKTNHEKYADARRIAEVFSGLDNNDPEFIEKLHSIKGRCSWCQENLNTWLLLKLNTRIGAIVRKLDLVATRQLGNAPESKVEVKTDTLGGDL